MDSERSAPGGSAHVGTITVEVGEVTRPLTNEIGFAWGYDGAGPSESAYAILTDLLGQEPEYPIIRDFIEAFLADAHRPRWTLTETELRAWLVARPPKPGLEAGAVR